MVMNYIYQIQLHFTSFWGHTPLLFAFTPQRHYYFFLRTKLIFRKQDLTNLNSTKLLIQFWEEGIMLEREV